MRRDRNPGGEMSTTHLTDEDVERILTGSRTGSDDLVKLEGFVAGISKTTPPHDPAHMATVLAATARSSRRTRGLRRLATLAASVALLVATSGIAMAADGAAPGDTLYGIDRTLEAIGIGDGGIDERLDEFDVLLDRGDKEKAFEFLDEVIADSPETEATEASQHLEAAVDSKQTAGENNGRGGQTVGSSHGQATSRESSDNQTSTDAEKSGSEPNGNAIGQDDETEPPGQERMNENRTEPDTAGPKDDRRPPEQTDEESEKAEEDNGQSEHADPQNNNDPPGQDKKD